MPMTFEEFLTWDYEHFHGGLAEWVDGEARVYMSGTELHQRVFGFLFALLREFVSLNANGVVLSAPYAMRAVPGGSAREPDIMYVAPEHASRLEQQMLNGPADLLIEIVSEDSVTRDRREKFDEYQAAGVREYWIIDPRPRQRHATFYALTAERAFRPGELGADGAYHSVVLPRLKVRPEWLWGDPPPLFAALAEIVGIERLLAALDAPGRTA